MSVLQAASLGGLFKPPNVLPGDDPGGADKVEPPTPPSERGKTSRTVDTVELSDASKALAWLDEQYRHEPELRLAPDELRELAHG